MQIGGPNRCQVGVTMAPNGAMSFALLWTMAAAFSISNLPLAVMLLATALVAFRTRAFPVWLAWLSVAVAIAQTLLWLGTVAESGPLAPNGWLTYALYPALALWLRANHDPHDPADWETNPGLGERNVVYLAGLSHVGFEESAASLATPPSLLRNAANARPHIAATSRFHTAKAANPTDVISQPGRAAVHRAETTLTGPLALNATEVARSIPLPSNAGATSQVASPRNPYPHISRPQPSDVAFDIVRAASKAPFASL